MMASTLAGISIAQTGTSIPHLLGYSLTYHKNLPHGLANAALYNGYLQLFDGNEKMEKLLNLLEFENVSDLINFINKKVVYSLKLTEDEILEFTNIAVKNQEKLRNHPLSIDKNVISMIFHKADNSAN